MYQLFIGLGLTLVFTTVSLTSEARRLFPTVTDVLVDTPANNQQKGGTVKGQVLDENHDPMIGALITVTQHGFIKGGGVSDGDGNYTIWPLASGVYDVIIKYQSYRTDTFKAIAVNTNKATIVNVTMELDSKILEEVIQVGYFVGLIDPYPTPERTISADEIEKMPVRQTDTPKTQRKKSAKKK